MYVYFMSSGWLTFKVNMFLRKNGKSSVIFIFQQIDFSYFV